MSRSGYRLSRLARRRTGWPIATMAYYGHDASRACKLVVGIMASEDAEPDLRAWIVDEQGRDLRGDDAVGGEVLTFLEQHRVRRIVTADRILGCPHQSGVDYEGDSCPDPACAYWRRRDRFTHEARPVLPPRGRRR